MLLQRGGAGGRGSVATSALSPHPARRPRGAYFSSFSNKSLIKISDSEKSNGRLVRAPFAASKENGPSPSSCLWPAVFLRWPKRHPRGISGMGDRDLAWADSAGGQLPLEKAGFRTAGKKRAMRVGEERAVGLNKPQRSR